jgi:hypothetical protein
MNFLHQQTLSPAAAELVEFDADSLRLIASGLHRTPPDVWLADPDAYEKAGRVLRDSDSPRLLAYSTKDHVLYASDGCNACSRHVQLPANNLQHFAVENGIRLELLEKLMELI